MGAVAVLFMQFSPKQEEWESLDDYCNPNPFIKEDKEANNE